MHRFLVSSLVLLVTAAAAADENGLKVADDFLRRSNASQAARELSLNEKTALAQTLRTPGRTIDDGVLTRLLTNPVAWRPGPDGRELLRSIIRSLPDIASVPGAGRSLASACNPDASNFRGFGFETIATAALHRYREPNGDAPRVLRMSADVVAPDGKSYETDGCAMFCGADRQQRLVSMKSVRSPDALRRVIKHAMWQLYQTNTNPTGGDRQPAILMLGYSDRAVLEAAQHKDWQAAAQRTGAKLLVLGVDQLSGQVTRIASVNTASGYTPRREPWPSRPPCMRQGSRSR
jgi:hypothetical protein